MIKRLKHLAQSALAHQGFMRYFANTSWMFGETMLRMISGLLVGIWVARYLGPEQFGIFSYAISFVSIFLIFAKLGLDNLIVQSLVLFPKKRDLYLGTAFWLKAAGSLLMFFLLFVATKFSENNETINIYIYIIAIGVFFQSFEVIDFYFQSKVLSRNVSICRILQLAISTALKVFLILSRAELIWFVLITIVDQLSLAVTLYFAYKFQKVGSFIHSFDMKVAKKLLNSSAPLILSGLAVSIYMRIDQIMIRSMLGNKDVGIYSAATRLSEVWYFIPAIISTSLFPAIVAAKKISQELYYIRLQRLYTAMVWLALGIALVITFLSSWIITVLYGPSYSGAENILAIHIWGAVFVFFGGVWNRWAINEGYLKTILYIQVLSLTSSIALNFILIPKYGVSGAAMASTISYSLGHTVFAFLFKNQKIAILMFWKSFSPLSLIKCIKN